MREIIKSIECQFCNENFYINFGDEKQPISKEQTNLQIYKDVLNHDECSIPYFLVYTTDRCNMKCEYCFNNKGDIKRNNLIPQYEIEELVSFFESLHCQEIHIRFFGGEPLISFKWIKECVDRLKSVDILFHYNIFTNGVLLNDDVIDFLCDNNFQYFVSLGMPDEREKGILYGEVVHDNVRKLLKKTRNVIGSAVWTPSSRVSIVDLLKYHFETGIKYITFLFEWGDKFDNESRKKVVKELEKFAEFYIDCILNHDTRYMMVHPFIDYLSRILTEKPYYYDSCSSGKTTAAITTDGVLYPCHCFSPHNGYEVGDVYEKRWEKRFQNLNVNNINPCNECDIKYVCKTYCYADNMLVNDDILRANTSKCFLEKEIIACCGYIVMKLMEHPVEMKALKKILMMERKDNVTH